MRECTLPLNISSVNPRNA